MAEAGTPVLGGDTTRAPQLVLSVTALGRSERVPGRGGARPGDLLVVTGPLGAAGRRLPAGPLRAPAAAARGGAPARGDRPRACSTSPTASAPDAGHIAERSGCRVEIDLDRVPLAEDATLEDLAFGEDYELLAAVPEPAGFAVVGRCVEGEGVVCLRGGEPVELTGWDHFR